MKIEQYREGLNLPVDIYRGKLKSDNHPYKKGDWVFGNLVKLVDGDIVSTCIYHRGEVFADTVSRCVGLFDYNGGYLFEGDIVQYRDQILRIVWQNTRFVALKKNGRPMTWNLVKQGVVIGNIWDNPELIERQSERSRKYE